MTVRVVTETTVVTRVYCGNGDVCEHWKVTRNDGGSVALGYFWHANRGTPPKCPPMSAEVAHAVALAMAPAENRNDA